MSGQKWQYVCLQIVSTVEAGEWKYKAIFWDPSGKALDWGISPNNMVLLNKLGEEGWEMVSTATTGASVFTGTLDSGHTYPLASSTTRGFWFKRPIS